jgi:hypothetical protein
MSRSVIKNKLFLTLTALIFTISVFSSEAFAQPGGHGGHGGGRGGDRYHYRDGRWYRDGWLWFDAGLTVLTVGAIAASLPPRYNTIYVGGVPYYYSDGIYYQPCSTGYIVVPAPAAQPVVMAAPIQTQVVTLPQTENANTQTAGESFVVNVPDAKGGYVSVTLIRRGTGFVGPQGEYYPEFPKVKQLKEMYGK